MNTNKVCQIIAFKVTGVTPSWAFNDLFSVVFERWTPIILSAVLELSYTFLNEDNISAALSDLFQFNRKVVKNKLFRDIDNLKTCSIFPVRILNGSFLIWFPPLLRSPSAGSFCSIYPPTSQYRSIIEHIEPYYLLDNLHLHNSLLWVIILNFLQVCDKLTISLKSKSGWQKINSRSSSANFIIDAASPAILHQNKNWCDDDKNNLQLIQTTTKHAKSWPNLCYFNRSPIMAR